MKKYTCFIDLSIESDETIWVVIDNSDLCNCIAMPINCEGKWIIDLNPNCPNHELSTIKILK